MARVVRLHETGGPDVLSLDEVDVRPPAEGEVRIAVSAIGLNRSDVIFRAGHHPVKPVLPSLLGSEAAGTIESIGPGVTGFKPGEAVSVLPRMAPEHGTMGELINAPASLVTRHPAGLSMEEAAALWAGHLTAFGGLVTAGGLQPGDHVLITAASSSVGLAAIQIANMLGAVPIATTRDESKAAQLREAGAHAVVPTDSPDWADRVMAATGERGAAVIFDAIGGPGLERLATLAARKGIYVLYGVMSSEPTPFPVQVAFARHLTLKTFVLDCLNDDQSDAIAFVTRGVADGRLRPVIDASYLLDDTVEAFERMESNRHFGKVVLTV